MAVGLKIREGFLYALGAVLVILLLYIFYGPTQAARGANSSSTLKHGLTIFLGLVGVGGYNLWQWLGGQPYRKDTSADDYD